jgi:hypothetical protein
LTKQNLIKYEDVKAGDVIEVTSTYPKGTEVITKGTVNYTSGHRIYSTDDVTLVYSTASPNESRTIELMFRPKLPFRVGTLIRAVMKKDKEEAILARVEQTSDDDEMVWLELSGTGDIFHTEDDIDTWTEMKLVPRD